MKFTDIINNAKYIKYGIEGKNYIDKRYQNLVQKGYTSEQAQDLIHFELGLKFLIAPGMKLGSKGACFAGGAILGDIVGTAASPGIGSFIGAGVGGFGAVQTCNKAIDYATDKSLQKLSEDLYKQNKDDRNKDIDLTKIKTYISGRKTYIQKPGSEIRSKKEYISSPQKRNLYDVLMNLPSPTGFTSNMQEKTENKLSGYLNPISGSSKIFTRENIGRMSTDEYLSVEKEINAQLNSIGIPKNIDMEDAMNAGDVVYVSSYTRDDGTKVRGYYRSKPRS